MTAPAIHIENAALAYGSTTVFSHIHATFPAGKWTGILGESGIGKSSLLRMIAGLTTPKEQWEGLIYTDNGIPVNQQIAYMAQTDLLLPWMTVLDNAMLGLKLRRQKHLEYAAQVTKAKSLLDQVGLGHVIYHYPQQLSGGMRQRVSLVRTLMEDKPIVLMDEPFSALDTITRYYLQALAADLLKNKTILFITHDPTEALRLANNIYVMQHQPATLTLVANLTTQTPRELNHPEVTKWQTLLFQTLTGKKGAA